MHKNHTGTIQMRLTFGLMRTTILFLVNHINGVVATLLVCRIRSALVRCIALDFAANWQRRVCACATVKA